MTLRQSRVAVLVVVGLLTFATSASAECAWVVWATGSNVPPEAVAAYSTVQECAKDLSDHADAFKRDGYIVHGAGPNSHAFHVVKGDERHSYLCLPDTVDPRGPKAK